jgi:hypothetical protein
MYRPILIAQLGLQATAMVVTAQTPPYTLTPIYYQNCQHPVSTNRPVVDAIGGWNLLIAQADAKAGPKRSEAKAYAWDMAPFDRARAVAFTWHASSWKVEFPAGGDTIEAAGTVAASGIIELLDPSAAGFGACLHKLRVNIANAEGTAQARAEGQHQSATGLLSLGTITLGARGVSWSFQPSVQTHGNTGSFPLTGPNVFDSLSVAGPGSMAVVTTECLVHAEAYADGWAAYPFWDIAEARVTVGTVMTVQLNGHEIAMVTQDKDTGGEGEPRGGSDR